MTSYEVGTPAWRNSLRPAQQRRYDAYKRFCEDHSVEDEFANNGDSRFGRYAAVKIGELVESSAGQFRTLKAVRDWLAEKTDFDYPRYPHIVTDLDTGDHYQPIEHVRITLEKIEQERNA